MADDLHDMGISYTSPVAHSVNLLQCFVSQGSVDFEGTSILRPTRDSLLGVEKEMGASYRSATFLRLRVNECSCRIRLISFLRLLRCPFFPIKLSATSARVL